MHPNSPYDDVSQIPLLRQGQGGVVTVVVDVVVGEFVGCVVGGFWHIAPVYPLAH